MFPAHNKQKEIEEDEELPFDFRSMSQKMEKPRSAFSSNSELFIQIPEPAKEKTIEPGVLLDSTMISPKPEPDVEAVSQLIAEKDGDVTAMEVPTEGIDHPREVGSGSACEETSIRRSDRIILKKILDNV